MSEQMCLLMVLPAVDIMIFVLYLYVMKLTTKCKEKMSNEQLNRQNN